MAFNTTILTADAFIITPSTNAAVRNITAMGFYVGGTSGQAKDINVVTSRGKTVLFKAVPVGTSIPLIICAVRTTNTTLTGLQLVGYGPQ
jgi:hypothetical protein